MTEIDSSGYLLVIGGTASVILALTWGGLQFPWRSAQVLVSLIVGFSAIIAFFVVERYWSREPTVSVYLTPFLCYLRWYDLDTLGYCVE